MEFPSTCWSRFTGTRSPDATQDLARRYWKPIYAYIRSFGAKNDDDARDLTQDFFVWMMESDFAAKADPARGRFRSFVKVVLKRYIAQECRSDNRLKRGGNRTILSLDMKAADFADVEPADPAGEHDPLVATLAEDEAAATVAVGEHGVQAAVIALERIGPGFDHEVVAADEVLAGGVALVGFEELDR